jgi:hypothetical protein
VLWSRKEEFFKSLLKKPVWLLAKMEHKRRDTDSLTVEWQDYWCECDKYVIIFSGS